MTLRLRAPTSNAATPLLGFTPSASPRQAFARTNNYCSRRPSCQAQRGPSATPTPTCVASPTPRSSTSPVLRVGAERRTSIGRFARAAAWLQGLRFRRLAIGRGQLTHCGRRAGDRLGVRARQSRSGPLDRTRGAPASCAGSSSAATSGSCALTSSVSCASRPTTASPEGSGPAGSARTRRLVDDWAGRSAYGSWRPLGRSAVHTSRICGKPRPFTQAASAHSWLTWPGVNGA